MTSSVDRLPATTFCRSRKECLVADILCLVAGVRCARFSSIYLVPQSHMADPPHPTLAATTIRHVRMQVRACVQGRELEHWSPWTRICQSPRLGVVRTRRRNAHARFAVKRHIVLDAFDCKPMINAMNSWNFYSYEQHSRPRCTEYSHRQLFRYQSILLCGYSDQHTDFRGVWTKIRRWNAETIITLN